MVLTRVFNTFSTLADIVVDGKEFEFTKQYLDHKRTICYGQVRLRSIILNVRQARASIDWERVKKKGGRDLALDESANEASQYSSDWLWFPLEVSPKATDPAAKIP